MNKPEMYRGVIKKDINNNRSVYASYNDKDVRSYSTDEIRNKINEIFSSNNFIYRTKVNMVIGNEVITRKVIGVYNNELVTIDNEHIPISSISDIYR